MSEPVLPPLADDVEALLREERVIPPSPPGLVDEVWRGLSGAVAPVPVPGAAPSAAAGGAKLATGAAVGGKLVVAVVSFVLGGATVAVVDRLGLRPPEHGAPAPAPPVVPQAPVAPPPVAAVPSPAPPPGALAQPAPLPRARPAPPQPPPAVPQQPALSSDEALREERALLEAGRMALVRGRFDAALAVAAKHELRFPEGQLAEEREFLAIQATWGLRHGDQARELADAFRRRYPKSLLLSALDELLAGSP